MMQLIFPLTSCLPISKQLHGSTFESSKLYLAETYSTIGKKNQVFFDLQPRTGECSYSALSFNVAGVFFTDCLVFEM